MADRYCARPLKKKKRSKVVNIKQLILSLKTNEQKPNVLKPRTKTALVEKICPQFYYTSKLTSLIY